MTKIEQKQSELIEFLKDHIDGMIWDDIKHDVKCFEQELSSLKAEAEKEVSVCDYKYHDKDIQYLGKCDKCHSNIKKG